MKAEQLVFPVIFLVMVFFSAGCLSSQPATQPARTAATTPPAVVTPQGITTPEAQAIIPVGTPQTSIVQYPAPVYVKRPYGFEPYSLQSGYQAKLQESHLDKDPATGERTVVGTIKNIGSDTINFVSITIDLYNNQGYLIGSLPVEVYYLQPGKTWQFRTDPVTQSDYSYYEIANIFTG